MSLIRLLLRRARDFRVQSPWNLAMFGLGLTTLMVATASVLVPVILARPTPPLVRLAEPEEGYYIPLGPSEIPLPPHANIFNGTCAEWDGWYKKLQAFKAEVHSSIYLYPPGRSRLSIVDTDITVIAQRKLRAATYVPCTFEGDGRASTSARVDFKSPRPSLSVELPNRQFYKIGQGATFEATDEESGVIDIFPLGEDMTLYEWTIKLKLVVDGKFVTKVLGSKQNPIKTIVSQGGVPNLAYDSSSRSWQKG